MLQKRWRWSKTNFAPRKVMVINCDANGCQMRRGIRRCKYAGFVKRTFFF